MGITIKPASGAADLAQARQLFVAYARSLPFDLAYQEFDEELAALPGKYVPPSGALLLAWNENGLAIGCVAVRPLPQGVCEMKRLYVAPAGRGTGAGRQLAEAAIAAARKIGYREIRLDTLPTMAEAQTLYGKLGFLPIAPYYNTPVEGTVFLGLKL